MTHLTRTLTAVAACLLVSGPLLAETPSEPGLLDKSQQAATAAAEWSKEKAKQGWDATKDGAGKATDWTVDKAEKGVDATAKGVDKAADWTADKAKRGSEWTQKKSQSLWERTKAFFSGDARQEAE